MKIRITIWNRATHKLLEVHTCQDSERASELVRFLIEAALEPTHEISIGQLREGEP